MAFELLNKFGFEGIAFDVAAGFQKIGVVHNGQTLVSSLPEVAGRFVQPAVVPRVGQLQPLKGRNQGFRFLRIDKQMNVVGHQTVMMAAETRGLAEKPLEKAQVRFVIGRGVKDCLPIIAPRQDVVGGLGSERT